MVLVGVTGGIGMGKSESATALTDLSVPWVDTDDLARQETRRGSEALGQIAGIFGADVLDSSGNLRRDRLASLVFKDPAARRQLEEILHPRIALSWRAQVQQWRQAATPVAAVIIPLLFEKQYQNDFSTVVCLACTRLTQILRLKARGWSDAQIHGRNSAQLPVSMKMERATFVVWTEGSLMIHRLQWERILHAIHPLPRSSTCCPA